MFILQRIFFIMYIMLKWCLLTMFKWLCCFIRWNMLIMFIILFGCSKNNQLNSQYKLICSICYDGYYLDINNQCQSCYQNGNNALRCSFDQTNQILTISQCQDGYFLVNNLCIKAQNNNTCTKVFPTTDGSIPDSRNCLECSPNYLLNGQTCYQCYNCGTNYCNLNQNGVSVCNQCISQYYADSNGVCQSCIKQCLTCTGPRISDCSECQQGYFQGNNSCIPCTFDKNGNATCQTCQDQQNCIVCLNGFYNLNGNCFSCQFGCSQCIQPGNICQSCFEGYFLQNGGCVLYQGNCLNIPNSENNKSAYNSISGCEACAYGFYLVFSAFTQSNNSQPSIIYQCLQCVDPDSAFVCRTNPVANQINSIIEYHSSSVYDFLQGSLPLQVLRTPRILQPTCIQGFFWNSQACMPCINITNGICACTNYVSCDQITCLQNFYLIQIEDQQECVPLPNGCSKIAFQQTKQLSCTECQQDFTLVGGVCLQYTGCLTINQNTGICTQCQEGYYFNWNFNLQIQQYVIPNDIFTYYEYFNQFCSPCQIYACQICFSAYTCDRCKLGYFWYESTINTIYLNPEEENIFINYQYDQSNESSGQCMSCPKYCATCLNQNQCHQCFKNFQISIDINNPDCICPSAYELDIAAGTCTPQSLNVCNLEGCLQCSTDGASCITCATNLQYYLTGNICTLCPKNCNSCQAMSGQSNLTTCIECQDGYYKIQDSQDSPINCQSCASINSGALRCQGTLENETTLTIIQCSNSNYLYDNNCYKIGFNRVYCNTISANNFQSCQTCFPDLILVGTTCIQCQDLIQNCQICTQNQSQTGYICETCLEGFVYNVDQNVCDSCPAGCLQCTVPNISTNVQTCQICYEGNYKDNYGNCQGCPFNCKSCQSQYLCTTCFDGSYLGESNIQQNFGQTIFRACYPCQNACGTCIRPGTGCKSCPSQSFLYQDGCIQNLITTTDSSGAITSIQYTLPCQQISTTGCDYCMSGFFLDQQNVCRECLAPYQNFVCQVYSIQVQPDQQNSQPSPNSTKPIVIGENPVQPNSYTHILHWMIILNLF